MLPAGAPNNVSSIFPAATPLKHLVPLANQHKLQFFYSLYSLIRSGRKIWGTERTTAEFNQANNCKDPAYR